MHDVSPAARALTDALLRGTGQSGAATAFGKAYATAGDGLGACLDALDDVCRAVDGGAAPPALVRHAALGWGAALERLFPTLACADPVTGLGSVPHLRSEVAGLYRAAGDGLLADPDVARSHVLLVLELPAVRGDVDDAFGGLEGALRRAAAAEALRTALPDCAPPAEVHPRRLVALGRRTDELSQHLAAAAAEVDRRLALSPSGGRCRTWAETLPADADAARLLLDELAR
ncbi:hypothetical protein ACFJIY_11860 [Pimelobacter simplex]|uniref:hypothetical protein n=1 Tax=Nocardioides simplex TaxID=2045 RepID=UPI00366C8EDD